MKKIIITMLFASAFIALTGCAKKKNIVIESVDDLKGLSIGVQAGTTGEIYAADVENVDLHSFKTGIDAALALKNGSIDAIILDELPAKQIVANNDDLKIANVPFSSEFYSIAVRKGDSTLLNSINETIKKLREYGTYDNLLKVYIPEDGSEVSYVDVEKTGKNGILKMGTNAAFPPFEYKEGSKVVGFDISLCTYIANNLDKTLEVKDMSFDSLIAALQSGSIDLIAAGMTVTEERKKSVDFSEPYFESNQVIIIRK